MSNIIGRKFSFWTVVGQTTNGRSRYFQCRCDCGAVRNVAYQMLENGRSKSCGCGLALLHLTGQKFGRLSVIREAKPRNNGRHWFCKCECGREIEVRQVALRNGKTKSCGCVKTARIIAASTTHGMAHTREYATWQRMKGRCTNPTNQDYACYGGRGIRVCNRWMDSFADFLADMGNQPSRSSIDRIDNDGDYEPSNCRWATQKQQCRNKHNNRRLTHNGETLCLTEWAERTGIKFGTLQTRLDRYGWSVERALSTPVARQK